MSDRPEGTWTLDQKDGPHNDSLLTSGVVGPWREAVRSLCSKGRCDPELCDCGFLGEWEHRFVFAWGPSAGYRRGDGAIRRDIARGFPPRPNSEGWWVVVGHDERCPSCGDVERFDADAVVVKKFAEQAKVVVFMAARR